MWAQNEPHQRLATDAVDFSITARAVYTPAHPRATAPSGRIAPSPPTRRVSLHPVGTHRPGEGARVARAGVGEGAGRVEQTGILGGGEPLALLAGRERNEVGKDLTGCLVRVPGGDGAEPRQPRAPPVGLEPEALVGLLGLPGRQQDRLACRRDRRFPLEGAAARLGVAQRLGRSPQRRERQDTVVAIRPDLRSRQRARLPPIVGQQTGGVRIPLWTQAPRGTVPTAVIRGCQCWVELRCRPGYQRREPPGGTGENSV